MRRLALAAVAALALAAPAVAQLPGGRALTADVSLSPSTHLFGDTIIATVDLVADPREFDPDRLRVALRFRPYEPVGGIREERRRAGGLVHVRYRATLRCLHVGCLAAPERSAHSASAGRQEDVAAERRTIPLPPVEILYRGSDGRESILLRRHFPPVQVVSRINTAGTGQEPRGCPGTFR